MSTAQTHEGLPAQRPTAAILYVMLPFVSQNLTSAFRSAVAQPKRRRGSVQNDAGAAAAGGVNDIVGRHAVPVEQACTRHRHLCVSLHALSHKTNKHKTPVAAAVQGHIRFHL